MTLVTLVTDAGRVSRLSRLSPAKYENAPAWWLSMAVSDGETFRVNDGQQMGGGSPVSMFAKGSLFNHRHALPYQFRTKLRKLLGESSIPAVFRLPVEPLFGADS